MTNILQNLTPSAYVQVMTQPADGKALLVRSVLEFVGEGGVLEVRLKHSRRIVNLFTRSSVPRSVLCSNSVALPLSCTVDFSPGTLWVWSTIYFEFGIAGAFL